MQEIVFRISIYGHDMKSITIHIYKQREVNTDKNSHRTEAGRAWIPVSAQLELFANMDMYKLVFVHYHLNHSKWPFFAVLLYGHAWLRICHLIEWHETS